MSFVDHPHFFPLRRKHATRSAILLLAGGVVALHPLVSDARDRDYFTRAPWWSGHEQYRDDLKLRFASRLDSEAAEDAGCAGWSDASEINAFDKYNNRVLVTNGKDVAIDIYQLDSDLEVADCTRFDLDSYDSRYAGVQSVAVNDDGIAVAAVSADPVTDPGWAVFFDTDGVFLREVPVGALPDMVTFTNAGDKVLVANEGEPRCLSGDTDPTNAINPEGSVTIIEGVGSIGTYTPITVGFTGLDAATLQSTGVRVGTWPGSTAAEDLEPEYIAVSDDDGYAYVTLQENNAIATIDIDTKSLVSVTPLGLKNHQHPANLLDASNEDGSASIRRWPVVGMFMPDSIAAFESHGRRYYATANEGDGREYFDNPENDEDVSDEICFTDETRVKDVNLDPGYRSPGRYSGELDDDENLGRLKMSIVYPSLFSGGTPPTNGDDPEDVPGLVYSRIASYGARSFSIWDADSGALVWDSGSMIAEKILDRIGDDNWVYGPVIGTEYTEGGEGIDDRSDDKGAEPEAIAFGEVDGRQVVAVGLERAGGIMLFDVTNPRRPRFLQWQQSQDVAPEGLTFVAANDSPSGDALLIVSYEETGTTVVYRFETSDD